MSKHTPGPWFVVNDAIYRRPKNDLYQYGGSVAGDMPLATVSRGWFNDFDGYPAEANAQLIAAAPDLLAACKLHIDTISNQKRNGEPLDSEQLYLAQSMMIKAINKATGEQP